MFNGAEHVIICETTTLLRMETREGDVVVGVCVAPITEVITDAISAALFDSVTVIPDGGDCNIDIVSPGPVPVTV